MPEPRTAAAALGIGLVTAAVFAPLLRHELVLLDPIAFDAAMRSPAVNVALHALNAGLVLLLLVRLTDRLVPSLIATVLFAVHPLRVESIAWIATGHDLLGMASGLGGILVYAAWARHGGWWRYAAALTLYAIAVTATTLAAPLPLVLLLLDAWPLARLDVAAATGDSRLPRRLAEKLPFALVAAGALLFAPASLATAEPASLGVVVANAFTSVGRYLGMTVVPVGLTPLRPPKPPPWWAPGAVLAVATTSVAALAARRRAPAVAIGWLWFLVASLPVLGRTPADRFTYLPSLGLALVTATGLAAVTRQQRRVVIASALVAVAACVVLTSRQIGYWRDEETVLRRALAVTADNFHAARSLGARLAARGAWDEAAVHIAEAVRLRPDDPDALTLLSALRLHDGHVDAAVDAATAALAARPDLALARMTLARAELRRGRADAAIAAYTAILDGAPDDATAHADLARALRQRGRLVEAVEHFERALALGAAPADVLGPLAQTLAESGDLDEATERYRQLSTLTPGDATVRDRLGTIAARRGDLATAEAEYRAALAIRPELAEAQLHLGTVLAARGALPEALAAYDAALASGPLPSTHYNRALVLEALGQPEDAGAALRAELAVQPQWPPALLRLAVLLAARGPDERAEAGRLLDQAAAVLGSDDPDVQATRDAIGTAARETADSP